MNSQEIVARINSEKMFFVDRLTDSSGETKISIVTLARNKFVIKDELGEETKIQSSILLQTGKNFKCRELDNMIYESILQEVLKWPVKLGKSGFKEICEDGTFVTLQSEIDSEIIIQKFGPLPRSIAELILGAGGHHSPLLLLPEPDFIVPRFDI